MIDKKVDINEFGKLFTKDVVIIGIATTGLKETDEIISVTITDLSGRLIVNKMIKPITSISEEAFKIHGISNEYLQYMSLYSDIHNEIISAIKDKTVCMYSADYGVRVFQQTCDKYGLTNPLYEANELFCVMKNYAPIYGSWNYKWKQYQYCSLVDAAKKQGVPYYDREVQSSLSDVFMMLYIIKSLKSGGEFETH